MTAPTYDKLTPPKDGTRVAVESGKWTIPNDPIVCLLRGELAHGEVVEDEQARSDEFGEAFGPGPVGVTASEVGQGAAGLGEADLGADADGLVAECLGDVALADADRAVDDDLLAGVQPAQRGEVADRGGGQFRAGGEVEAFDGGLLVEVGAA